MANPIFRFAHQDDYTLAMLAHRRLDELVVSGEGTHLTPAERREMQTVTEQLLDGHASGVPRSHLLSRQRR